MEVSLIFLFYFFTIIQAFGDREKQPKAKEVDYCQDDLNCREYHDEMMEMCYKPKSYVYQFPKNGEICETNAQRRAHRNLNNRILKQQLITNCIRERIDNVDPEKELRRQKCPDIEPYKPPEPVEFKNCKKLAQKKLKACHSYSKCCSVTKELVLLLMFKKAGPNKSVKTRKRVCEKQYEYIEIPNDNQVSKRLRKDTKICHTFFGKYFEHKKIEKQKKKQRLLQKQKKWHQKQKEKQRQKEEL